MTAIVVEPARYASAAELFAALYPSLVRLAALLVGSQALAEEVVQDAFLKLHQRWASVANPEAYVRQAVVNGSRSAVRKLVVARRHAPALVRPEAAAPTHDHVWDAVQALPVRQRTALVLRYYADWHEADIAAAMDCRPATVRSLVYRALETLRKEVER